MFENVKTYCKMKDKEAAYKHADMLGENPGIISAGVAHDLDSDTWRSWFISEQWTGDKPDSETNEGMI